MTNSQVKGCLFVVSGSSGVGKGTIVSMFRKKHPEIALSVSATTRRPRKGELDGVHYCFISKEEFLSKIEKAEFLEWAEFSGNYYGTDKVLVEKTLAQGKDIILEIDVQGALQVKKLIPEAILLFIEPPSVDALRDRLFRRKTESEQEIQNRLEIVKSEMLQKNKFNCTMINDNIDKALLEFEKIILAQLKRIKN